MTAVRASAENADRALMLGIGVRRIHIYVWVIAATLVYVGLFLRAGAVGLSETVTAGDHPVMCSQVRSEARPT